MNFPSSQRGSPLLAPCRAPPQSIQPRQPPKRAGPENRVSAAFAEALKPPTPGVPRVWACGSAGTRGCGVQEGVQEGVLRARRRGGSKCRWSWLLRLQGPSPDPPWMDHDWFRISFCTSNQLISVTQSCHRIWERESTGNFGERYFSS